MTTTLIRDATIITVDGDRSIFAPGALVVRDQRIVDVGPADTVAARATEVDTTIDARGKLVLPGFVSSHNHLGYAVFRGRAEDIGYAPTQRLYMPMGEIISRAERCDIGSLAIAELLCGGVSTVLEMEEDADVFAPYIEQVGMRASMGIMVHDVDVGRLLAGEVVFDPAVRDAQLEQAVGFAEQWHGRADGRILAVMTANGPASSSPQQLEALRATADRMGLRLSIHLGSGESPAVQRLHGIGSLEFAREHGFLADDVVAVHCYKIDEADVTTFADAGAQLSHCPLMNAMRGSIAPVQDLRMQGVNVGLGIDNYFSDFYDVLRACIAVARIRADDPEVLPASEVLELATIDSARALGLEADIGSLEVGKKADLQIVDMRRFGLTPVNDPLRTLVYHGHAKDVDTVMVDGRVVVSGGRLADGGEQGLLDAAAHAADAAWGRFADRHGGYAAAFSSS